MKKKTTEVVEPVVSAEMVEAPIETPTAEAAISEAKPSRIASAFASVKAAPKWVLMAVPAAVVALASYGYLHHQGNQADTLAQAPMVAGPFGQAPQANGPIAPVAFYGPGYSDGYYSDYRGYGDGYGRGYGRGYGHGNGRARGNFSFSMGGNLDGDAGGWGNGYGDGVGRNRYNNGYYYY
jgi:hypothetical protein